MASRSRSVVLLVLLGFAASLLSASPASAGQPPPDKGDFVFQWIKPSGGDGVFVAHADGRGARPRGADVPGSRLHPDFSPSGDRIVFSDQATGLWVTPFGGGRSTLVLACGDACDYPAWSPDGTRILFTEYTFGSCDCPPAGSSLKILDLLSGSVSTVVTEQQPRLVDVGRWSPSGDRIVYGIDLFDADYFEEGSAIAVVDADGGSATTLTPYSTFAYYPDWNRLTGEIVYSVETLGYVADPGPEAWNLFAIRPDGTGTRQITDVPSGWRVWQPSWTPDGARITATLDSPDGRQAVFVDPTTGEVSSGILPATHVRLRPAQ